MTALLAAALALSATAATADCNHGALTVFTPVFRGKGSLTTALSQIMNLQIWTTLRKAQGGRDFGCGALIWDDFGDDASLDEIMKRTPPEAALVFWGQIQPVGDGIVVQSLLARPPGSAARSSNRQVWTVTLDGASVAFDPIRRSYRFAPFALDDSVLKHFTGIPNLVLCHDRVANCAGEKVLNNDINALEQQGDYAKAKVNGRVGWIYLPPLQKRSEVIDFVSGLVRLMRGDYSGADEMMSRIQASDAASDIKLNALVVHAVALELQGKSGYASLVEAQQKDPFARDVVQLLIMDEIRSAAEAKTDTEKQTRIARAHDTLKSIAHLFDAQEPWFVSAQNVLRNRDQK